MNEKIKKFLAKVIIVVVAVFVLYQIMSPYQNCIRAGVNPERCIVWIHRSYDT